MNKQEIARAKKVKVLLGNVIVVASKRVLRDRDLLVVVTSGRF